MPLDTVLRDTALVYSPDRDATLEVLHAFREEGVSVRECYERADLEVGLASEPTVLVVVDAPSASIAGAIIASWHQAWPATSGPPLVILDRVADSGPDRGWVLYSQGNSNVTFLMQPVLETTLRTTLRTSLRFARALREPVQAKIEAGAGAASDSAWQALARSVIDVVMQIGPDGHIVYANRSIEGIEPRRALGRDWATLFPAEHASILRKKFDEIRRGRPATSVELVLTDELGETRWLTIQLRAIEHPPKDGALALIRDITELRRSEAALRMADRLTSLGTMAAGVAHEINNPLASVIANLELAREDLRALPASDTNTRLTVALRDATDGARRIRSTVLDLKVFSHSEESVARPIDVARCVESCMRLAWNVTRHRARYVKDIPSSIAPVSGNEARIGQVFLNLLINAAQAIEPGRADQNEIRVSARNEGSMVIIEIADTGHGIPPEVLARLFTPFFTTKSVGEGTGLGLSICQRIVSDMGGRIEVTSEVGAGSKFTVRLPATSQPVLESMADHDSSSMPRVAGGRVMVIDDEPAVISVIERALPLHKIVSFSGAEAALAELRQSPQPFPLILCDLMMPQLTGEEFLRTLRSELPAQAERVVLMTGGAVTVSSQLFLSSPGVRSIAKPFSVRALRQIIEEYLG